MAGWNKGQISTIENPRGSKIMLWLRDVALKYEGDDCLLWPFGCGHNGYPSFGRDGKSTYVHRLMCERRNGPPPTPEHHAAHECGNPKCVNEAHLSWKTNSENQHDRSRHGTHANGRRWKLTPADVAAIRAAPRRRGIKVQLARRFNVSHTTIRQILSGQLWPTGDYLVGNASRIGPYRALPRRVRRQASP